MIVIQVLLAGAIFAGLMISAYNVGVDVGREFTKQFPEDEEPEVYRHENKT